MNIKVCGDCVLMQHNGGICPIFRQTFPHDQQGCPMHASELNPCELCGNHISHGGILETVGDTIHIYCESCQQKMGSCLTCQLNAYCAFLEDPSPIPKTIRKQVRQGNMITVTEVMNPERVEKTCKNGCSCFDSEFGCFRQNNCCGNWKGPWS